jgi:hypothetical protein
MITTKKLFFSWDFLTIYDGGSNTSPRMGMYCGDSIPPSHASSNNEVLLNFHSDEANSFGDTYGGFKMEYNPTGKQITTIQNNWPNADNCQQNSGVVKNHENLLTS